MEVDEKTIPASAAQNLYLDQLHQDVEEVLRASEALFASLTPRQLTWKPGRRKWSILQCFDHMLVTNGMYMERLFEAIQQGKVSHAEAISPFKPTWFGKKFIDSMRADSKLKVKTFRIFRPADTPDDLGVKAKFIEQQKSLLELIKLADHCDLNKARLSSPANRLIRFSVGEALTLLVVHEQRHLLQAQNIQLHADFPAFQA